MSKPIENCPQPETPIRERAYTDRQLLELAARAAGYEVAREADDRSGVLLFGIQDPWNPLADDGDALRLVVKLDLLIAVCTISGGIRATQVLWSACGPSRITEEHGSDHYAATRRAIVRAAAAIAEGAKS